MSQEIHVSIVSHGHGEHIELLLHDLAQQDDAQALQLSLILNVPEQHPEALRKLTFPYTVIENSEAKGFAANHNVAFQQAPASKHAKYFLVLNPDVRLQSSLISDLAQIMREQADEQLSVLGPTVYDENGLQQSSGRIFPDFGYLFKKLIGREPENPIVMKQGLAQVDWVAGMCMLIKRDHFEAIGGFDEQYRLYYEDVDLCLRFRQAGLFSAITDQCQIVHQGQWQSRRDFTHLRWHISSIWRFLAKMRLYKKVIQARQQP
ncbi:MAG: glycosyltransferase family 2 protein [Pseudomonadota bacterium]